MNFTKALKIVIIGLILSFGVSSIFAAWSNPIQLPTGGNIPPPVNESAVNQIKNSGLSLNSLAVFGNADILEDLTVGLIGGTAVFKVDYLNNRVGINTDSPTEALSVVGFIRSDLLIHATEHSGSLCADTDGTIIVCPVDVIDLPTDEWQSQEFTSSGLFTIPQGITQVTIEGWGAGGGGGGGAGGPAWGSSFSTAAGAGGGGSGGYSKTTVTVTPGSVYQTVIGVGGASGYGGDGYSIRFGFNNNDNSKLAAATLLAVEEGGGVEIGPGGEVIITSPATQGGDGEDGGETLFLNPSGVSIFSTPGGEGGEGGDIVCCAPYEGIGGSGAPGFITYGLYGANGGPRGVGTGGSGGFTPSGSSPDGSGNNSGSTGTGGSGGSGGAKGVSNQPGGGGSDGQAGTSGSSGKIIIWWQGS